MPRLLEADAEFLTLNYDTLAPDKQAEAKDWLQRYKQQQADEGEPLFPSVVTRQVEQENNLRRMFEAPDKIDYDPGYTSADPLHDKMQHANMAFLASRYQKEPAEVASRYDFLLNDYARQKLGASEDVDTAKFYALAQKDMQKVKLREDTQREGMSAALRGEDGVKALSAWQAKNADRAKDDAGLFMRGYQQALEQDGEMLPIADRLLPLLEAQSAKKDGQAFDQTKAQELGNMIEQLAGMKKAQRKSVYRSIAARIQAAGYDQKGFWSQMLGFLDQQLYAAGSSLTETGGIAADVATAVAGAQTRIPDTFDGSSVSLPVLSDEEQQALLRQRDYRERIGDVEGEIMQIISDELDPVKPTTGWMNETIETGLIKAPGAILPSMGASALLGPYGAGLLFTADFASNTRRELVQSGMDADQARKIAVMAAPLQAAVESLSNMVSLGKFPAVQAALSRFTRPVGGASLVGRYVQNSLISGATEFTEEQVQANLIVPVIQEVLGVFETYMPEVDWDFYKTRAANTTPELAATLLPMALVFGGVMTAADAKLSRTMTQNVDLMMATGMDQAQAVEIASQPTHEQRIKKGAELWLQRKGTKASMEEAQKKLADQYRTLAADSAAAVKELEARGVLPRLLPMQGGEYRLTFNDGSTADFKTREEALGGIHVYIRDRMQRSTRALRETIDTLTKNLEQGREFALEISPEAMPADEAVKRGIISPQALQERAAQGAILDATTLIENSVLTGKALGDEETPLMLFGMSKNEWYDKEGRAIGMQRIKDDILRTTMRLWDGASPLTLIEEKTEGDAKVILSTPGKRQWMLDHLRAYEDASGDKLFTSDDNEQINDKQLIEAWSHMAQSYFVAAKDKVKGLTLGRYLRDIEEAELTAAMQGRASWWQAVVNRAQKLGELKAAGKLGADVVAELEKQLGIDSQVKHEQGAMQEAQNVANEVAQQVDTSGYSEANPGPNGETFSMASASGAAQANEPSPGGLSEAESIRFDKFSKEWAGAPPYAKELLLQTMRGWAEGGNNRGKEISTIVDPIAGLFPKKQRERISGLLTAHANSAAAIYNDAGGRIHLEQGVSKKLLTWADRVWRFFAIGSSLAPPHKLKEKIAKTGSRYYSDASGRMIFRLSDHRGGMWDGNAFISSKLGEDAPFDLRPLPDEDFHQLARRILRYAALNDEATKVSQGGFQKQESSEASAFGGTWPQNGEPTTPEVNSFNPARAAGGTQDTFSLRVTPAQDAEYLAAVEAGDMQTAQRMVDEAAKAAGERKLYHVGQMERPALRQESVTGGVGEVYLTEQPTAWAAALEREGDPVSQWYLPDSTIAKTQPSRRELVDWAISRGFMEMKSVTKPDGTTVFELDDKTPLIRPEETLKGKSLPFYNTQDPMRGGNQQKHLIYAYLKERGFAAYEAEYSRDGHEIIVFAPSQIKSADPVTRDESGNVIPLSQRFNPADDRITFSLRVTPAQDAEYMAAVDAGDSGSDNLIQLLRDAPESNRRVVVDAWLRRNPKAAANMQRLVNDAALSNATKVTRHTEEKTDTPLDGTYRVDVDGILYRTVTQSDWDRIESQGFLDSDQRNAVSRNEGVNLANNALSSITYAIPGEDSVLLGIKPEGIGLHGYTDDSYIRTWDKIPYDSIIPLGKFIGQETKPSYLADITFDESGNVIPLSQRFNPADDRITYSLRPGDFASRVEAMFLPFQRSPEARLVMARVAKDRALRLGNELIEKANVIRTIGSIDREARVRAALAEDKAVQDYLDGLTPAARQTLEWQPADLQDDPLIAAMLDVGKLMSKTTAVRRGLDNLDEFEAVPWLPPSFYSSGAGITPGKMAKALYEGPLGEGGILNDGDPATLWSELSKRIEATRKDKAAHREAVQAFKDAKKAARDAASKEADKWADNAKKQAGSGKAQRDRIKAWIKLHDAILAAIPAIIRHEVGSFAQVADYATDEAAMRFLESRVAKMDKVLEKYLKKNATGSINRLFKRAAADYTAGKKAKGKLGPDEHYLFQRAEAASEMDAAALRGELAKLDALADDESLSDDQRALAVLERGIVELVGDMKNADSGRLFTAFDELSRLYAQGVVAWKAKQTARREARQAVRDALQADAGKSGVLKERQAMEKAMATLFGKAKSAWLSVSSFSEVLRYAFGSKSQQATELIDGEREASNAYEDEQQAIADELESLFASMAGGKTLDGERLRFDMAQRTIKAGDVELSQFEAITALLMWRQEDGRRHMEGTFDEDGKRTSGWSYDQAWIDEVEKQLTPEGRRVMAWLAAKYGSEHGELNALYRERHGVNLPAHDNYAPLTVKPMQATAGEIVDPVSGAAVSGSILTPGSLRTRSRMAVAEPEFRDALQTFVAHKKQMGYWKAYYDLATDMQAVLGNRELMNSVEAAAGKEAVVTLRKRMDVLAQGGVRDAAAGLAMNSMFQRMMSRAATVGLLGRVSTLLVQSTQLAAASVQMPVGAYLRRFGKLLAGQLDWKGALQSDFIQRRIQTAPPIVRQAMENLGTATRPNLITRAVRNLGNLLSGADGLFTGGTYAILLDYHRETGRKLGLTGADLEEHAHREAERATEEVAQPTRTATRSLAELTATNPLAKVSFAYASEARQKIALLGWSLANFKADPVRFGKAAFLVFGVGGVMSQVLKNIWKEAKGDDDEEKWSPERLIKGSVVNALHGIPMMSELMGEPGMFSSTAWAQAALDDLLKGEADLRDINTLLGTLGLFNDTAAGIAAMSNAGYDFAKIIEAAFSE